MKPLLLCLAIIAVLIPWLAAPPAQEEFRELRFTGESCSLTVTKGERGRYVATDTREREHVCSSCMPDQLIGLLPDGRKLTAPLRLSDPVRALLTESEVQRFVLEIERVDFTNLRLLLHELRYPLQGGRLYLDKTTYVVQGRASMEQSVTLARLSMEIEKKCWEAAFTAAVSQLLHEAGPAADKLLVYPNR